MRWLLIMRRAAADGGDASAKQEQKNGLAAEIEELRHAVERLADQYVKLAQSISPPFFVINE